MSTITKNYGTYLTPSRTSATRQLPDLVCLSHLRWDFVYQRPQHLLSRFAREGRRVFFIEEPLFGEGAARLDVSLRDDGVRVVVPHLPQSFQGQETDGVLKTLLDRFYQEQAIKECMLWYYTPMAIRWSNHLQPLAVIYDCMDELSAFRGAPLALREREQELFEFADLVFTGGQSLYEAKRDSHPKAYAFPSSIDAPHFAEARCIKHEPEDQASIPHPRLGFCGVIDERMDLELLDKVAEARPDWQLVVIGPVVKIDPNDLPRRANIHYLGSKKYKELPVYLAGWDVALLPFARNESTRFISPTKTPEYLAAGKPVVSTSIRDVVRPYGDAGFVHIADTADEFVAAIVEALQEDAQARIRAVDAFLSQTSWDRTWRRMSELIEDVVNERREALSPKPMLIKAAAATASARASEPRYISGD
jgi:UDP-galactopyranose mutase